MRRVDTTAKFLITVAKQCGAKYLPINGAIDGLVMYRDRVWLVDWKSAGGMLTPEQSKLVAAGWPIKFISDESQLIALIRG